MQISDLLLYSSHFSLHKISERHQLLRETIGTRQDENDSYKVVTHLNGFLTPIFLIALCLEIFGVDRRRGFLLVFDPHVVLGIRTRISTHKVSLEIFLFMRMVQV